MRTLRVGVERHAQKERKYGSAVGANSTGGLSLFITLAIAPKILSVIFLAICAFAAIAAAL